MLSRHLIGQNDFLSHPNDRRVGWVRRLALLRRRMTEIRVFGLCKRARANRICLEICEYFSSSSWGALYVATLENVFAEKSVEMYSNLMLITVSLRGNG